MITSIYILKDKLDLFEDDTLELKSSIAEIGDITKVFTDSTNSFSVPATDNNNKIFKHFYNANLIDGWDVFNKVRGVIELNGVLYKQVNIKLNSVILKSNKPTSYNIQAFGLLTQLKDLFSDDKLSDLDFSSYDFDYTGENILDLATSNTVDDLVATTLTTKRIIYDSDSSVNNTDSYINIANNNTSLDSGFPVERFGISILNKVILERIEAKYNITFSRDYFGSSAFSNLYMLLNGGDVENSIEEQVVFNGSNSDPTLENNRVLLSTNLPYSDTTYFRIFIDASFQNRDKEFTIITKANGVEINRTTRSGNENGEYGFSLKKSDYEDFENLTFFFKSSFLMYYQMTIVRRDGATPYGSYKTGSTLSGVFNVSNKMPDIKVIDYIKGFFDRNKLIAYNTSDTEIYVNSLNDYYRSGVVKNIDEFVDYKDINISTGKIFNEINYKFKEPKTILAKQFFENNNVNYGDLEYKILNSNGKLVDGESIDVKLLFENMVYEKLVDLSGNDTINFMYGLMANDSLEPVTVNAHLHYVERISTTDNLKVFETPTTYALINNIKVPSHTFGFNLPVYSNFFGEEFNEYNGVRITNTIFSNFHQNYIENAFNSQKRLFKINCKNLPIDFLINIQLNDVLEFKDNYYRINKYNLNLITKECSFEVYNIKNLDLTPLVSITTDTTLTTTDSTIITADNNL